MSCSLAAKLYNIKLSFLIQVCAGVAQIEVRMS